MVTLSFSPLQSLERTTSSSLLFSLCLLYFFPSRQVQGHLKPPTVTLSVWGHHPQRAAVFPLAQIHLQSAPTYSEHNSTLSTKQVPSSHLKDAHTVCSAHLNVVSLHVDTHNIQANSLFPLCTHSRLTLISTEAEEDRGWGMVTPALRRRCQKRGSGRRVAWKKVTDSV